MADQERTPVLRMRRRWRAVVLLALGAMAIALAVPPPAAANALTDAEVMPRTGTPATSITFRVDYVAGPPQPRGAEEVWAEVVRTSDGAIVTVPLALEGGGSPTNGTWSGSSTLPVGSWQVTFRVEAEQGVAVPDVDGGPVEITDEAPRPAPRPTPSPNPTAAPTAAPSPSPSPGDPPAPGPPGPPPPPPPRSTSAPGASPGEPSASGSPGASAPASATIAAASHSSAREDAGASPSEETSASPDGTPEPDERGGARFGLLVPWLLLGGVLASSGAAVLATQWLAWRRRRR